MSEPASPAKMSTRSPSRRPKRVKLEVSCEHFYKKIDENETENLDYLGRRRSCRIKEKPKVEPLREDWLDDLEALESARDSTKKEQSEYERLRLKNIEEKAALLQSLGIDESKRILAENQLRKKRIPKPPKEPIPLREPSLRLRKKSPVVQSSGHYAASMLRETQTNIHVHEEYKRKETVLGPLSMEESYYQTKEYLSPFLDDLKKLSHCYDTEDATFRPVDKSWFDSVYKMKIRSDQFAKVVPGRICSVAVHPSTSRLLAVAGDKYGSVGFWDVEAKDELDGIHLFKPHERHVSCIAFTPGHPEKMYTSSYDGTVRCTDLEKFIFDEILQPEDPDDHMITFFDFVSSHTLCLSHGDGCLEVIDTRSKEEVHLMYQVGLKRLKTVSVHPVQKHYVMTASNDGGVNIWDLRYMTSKPKPISEMPHFRNVNSAFFSPETGNSVLTISSDNYIRLYDVTNLTGTHSPKTEIRHDNCVGRWLTNFQPVWVPGREDCFVVGCMKQPRRIELFLTSGKVLVEFYGEELVSVCSINAFHPTENCLVGGNSSGRMFAFK